jgi:hypothetical protein
VVQRTAQGVLVEEEQGGQGLILRRGCHVVLHGEAREEGLDVCLAHFARMPAAVKEDETFHPVHIGTLRVPRQMTHPDRLPHTVEEPGRGRCRLTHHGYTQGWWLDGVLHHDGVLARK